MLQIALRGVRANPFRYLATVIAIVLGVAFFTATSVLTTSFRDSINGSIAEAFEDVDVAVRSSSTIETDFFEIRQQIPAATEDRIAALDGVESASAYLAGYARVVTAEGRVVGGAAETTEGFAWNADPDLNPFTVVAGRAPDAPDEVVIDEDTAAEGGVAVGDTVRVLPLPADQRFTVVGLIRDDESAFAGQSMAFGFEGAARVFGTTDVDQIFVEGVEGIGPDELVDRISPQLPSGLEAVTGQTLTDEFQDLIGQIAGIINTALQVFAGVALFVGAFVIYNTFSITVAQRTREMALLRAIGASGRQVSRSVVIESVVVGVIASVLGAAAGIGLGWVLITLLTSFIDDFDIGLSVPSQALGIGVLLGTLITIGAAYLPARRGARVAPIEALRDSAVEPPSAGRTRTLLGLGLLVGGVAVALGAVGGLDTRVLPVGLGLVVIATVLLGPAVMRPMSRLLAIPFVRNGSITGELARENASRNPKRTATTSLTLMIGVALVVTAAVFAATLGASVRGQLEERLLADQVVQIDDQVAQSGGGLDPGIAPAIAATPGVSAAVAFRTATGEIDGSFVNLTGADTAGLESVVDLDVIDGSVTGLGADEVALREDVADDRGLAVGDVIDVRFQQTTAPLTVAAVYDGADELVGDWMVDNAALDANTNRSLDTSILVRTDGGPGTAPAIDAILAGDPTAELTSKESYISDQAGQINGLLNLLYGLLGMSVLVALIGIVNTLALSIHERTRELGLLRAVGMTSRQLRRTIRYESTLIALMGTLIGLAMGLYFGWVASEAGGDALRAFVIPWTTLVVVAIVGIVAGLLAGVLPARRAGRLDVLDAIATE